MASSPRETASPSRRLIFVNDRAEAPQAEASTTVVVLDPVWTPTPGERPDILSARPAIEAVIERLDVPAMALDRLETWGEAATINERLTVDGVSYWHRAREPLWRWVHERLLWRRVVTELVDRGGLADLVVPEDRSALVDIAGWLVGERGPEMATDGGTGGRGARDPTRDPTRGSASPFAALRRWTGLGRRSREAPVDSRTATLKGRIRSWSTRASSRVVVLSHFGIRQAIGSEAAGRPIDPNLGSVIERLRADGHDPMVIGLGLDHRSDADWATIEGDQRLLPASLLQTRWRSAEESVTDAIDGVVAALAPAVAIPLDLDGVDIAPALVAELQSYARGQLDVILRQVLRIGNLLDELRPGAILLSHEGIRTAWLVAARRRAIPTFAAQHGVIYPKHPGYRNRTRAGLVLPTCTFVFGEYERRVLLDQGHYQPAEVAVSGSPRLDLDVIPSSAGGPVMVADRLAIRQRLGVQDGDRLLVVSTTFMPFIRDTHFVRVLERVLGGPLPGIHVVFKQHPGEPGAGPYAGLLEGLAKAGDYPPPRMTVVREIDLLRLLRAADAHLGYQSTVLTDAVIAGTHNLIAVGEPGSDVLGYVAAGVAHPVRSVADVREQLDRPTVTDPVARDAFIADHFRAGDASSRIARAIEENLASPR
jgi:hypothetical protein